jgi:uncharacterized protein (UPF0335 family)
MAQMGVPKTFIERQALLNRLLRESAEQYKAISARHRRFALREIDRIRLELIELLMKYADKDNRIAINRLNSLLRELERLQEQTRKTLEDSIRDGVRQSAEYGVDSGLAALRSALTGTAEAAIVASHFDYINDRVFQYVVNRFGKDGLVLSDRIWKLSHEQYNEIEAVIRSGIVNGTSVNTMVRQIKKVYDTEEWKVKRLVITEGNTAYRTASAYLAQESRVVKGLRIHRGRANRPNHRCTQLEKIDRYGLGTGIYLPTDPEVLNPHPNCTSYVTYELVEVKNGVNAV